MRGSQNKVGDNFLNPESPEWQIMNYEAWLQSPEANMAPVNAIDDLGVFEHKPAAARPTKAAGKDKTPAEKEKMFTELEQEYYDQLFALMEEIKGTETFEDDAPNIANLNTFFSDVVYGVKDKAGKPAVPAVPGPPPIPGAPAVAPVVGTTDLNQTTMAAECANINRLYGKKRSDQLNEINRRILELRGLIFDNRAFWKKESFWKNLKDIF